MLASLFFWTQIASGFSAGSGSDREQTNAGSNSAVQTDNDFRELELGKLLERDIAGGQHHSYQVTLSSGQFLHAVVEPRSIGVTARLFGPNSKAIMSLHVTAGSSEPLFLIAKEQGSTALKYDPRKAPLPAATFKARRRCELLVPKIAIALLLRALLPRAEQLSQEGMAEDSNRALAESALARASRFLREEWQNRTGRR